jgi:hypothetical protein
LIEDFPSESVKWVSEYFVKVVTRHWKVVPSFHRHGCLKLALHVSCDVVGPPSHQTGIPIWSTEVHCAEYPDVIWKIPGENNAWLLPTSGR